MVTIVGGGVSVAALVEELPTALDLDAVEIRLVARDVEVLNLIAGHCRHLVASRPEWSVRACPSLDEGVDGAHVVVLMHRIGGLAARQADEVLARRFGIPGDEGLGPGGLANAARTLPVLAGQADLLRRRVGGAPILNLVAPLGLTTRLLVERGLNAVGICELPGETRRRLTACLPEGTAPSLAYAGFNHLGWFWPARGSATEAFAAAVVAGLVDTEVLARFGAAPLKYYYWLHDTDAAARLGIARDPDRTQQLMQLRARALEDFATAPARPSAAVAARATPWLSDALVPVLVSALCDRPWAGYANVVNRGLVPALSPDVVVEVPALFHDGTVEPEPLAAHMPAPVLRFLRQVDASDDLAYRSWRDDDPALLEDAFVEGPHRVERARAHAIAASLAASDAVGPARQPGGHRGTLPVTRAARFDTSLGTSSEYLVGPGARHDRRLAALLDDRPVAVVIDQAVARLDGGLAQSVLGGATCLGVMTVSGGEGCKTFDQLRAILEFFDECKLPKHGVVVAIGGGTVSDVVGLAALLIRRSVSLVLVPTTLLAQVDAAIGGKNGINSGSTKNLVGYFCHPKLVACDQELLRTLSWRQVVCGIAESIKVFAVSSADVLGRHAATWQPGTWHAATWKSAGIGDLGPWREAVWDAVDCKLRLLGDDPYEASSRRLLNYGHAVAHLLEERTGYQLTHGEAVLLGMLVENEISCGLGIAEASIADLQATIARFLTPACSAHWLSFADVGRDFDKVRQMRRGMMNLVCLARPGEAVIVDDVADDVVARAWRRAGERVLDSPVWLPPSRPDGDLEPASVAGPSGRDGSTSDSVRSMSWP